PYTNQQISTQGSAVGLVTRVIYAIMRIAKVGKSSCSFKGKKQAITNAVSGFQKISCGTALSQHLNIVIVICQQHALTGVAVAKGKGGRIITLPAEDCFYSCGTCSPCVFHIYRMGKNKSVLDAQTNGK